LLNWQKVQGASGEGFWRQAAQRFVLQATGDTGGQNFDADELSELAQSLAVEENARERLEDASQTVNEVADDAFSIMMTLQFQDILRQQLSAVAGLLSKTRANISRSLGKITGEAAKASDGSDAFAVMDDSILGPGGSQEQVDEIIKKRDQSCPNRHSVRVRRGRFAEPERPVIAADRTLEPAVSPAAVRG